MSRFCGSFSLFFTMATARWAIYKSFLTPLARNKKWRTEIAEILRY